MPAPNKDINFDLFDRFEIVTQVDTTVPEFIDVTIVCEEGSVHEGLDAGVNPNPEKWYSLWGNFGE